MVSTFVQPDFSSQSGATYKGAIDASISVFSRMGTAFAPTEQSTPDLTVALAEGYLPSTGGTALVVAAQNTAGLTAPVTHPRKDIIYVDNLTGAVGVAGGVEELSPSDPTLPSGKSAVARINWTAAMSEITNADLDDLRHSYMFHGVLTGVLSLPTTSELTIASGVVTPTGSYHTVDTESDAASDDLDMIDGANIPTGGLLFLEQADDGRDVVIKNNTGTPSGTQLKIFTSDGKDYTLETNAASGIVLRKTSVGFIEILRRLGTHHVRDNVTSTLAVGYDHTPYDHGTVDSGTVTLAFTNGHVQTLTNNGAFDLDPPASGYSNLTLCITNDAAAGAINLDSFDVVNGDDLTTTDTHAFTLWIERNPLGSIVFVQAMQ